MAGQGSINFVKGMKRMAAIVGRSDYFATSFLPSFLPSFLYYSICKRGNDSILSPAWVGGGMLPFCMRLNELFI